MSYEKQKEYETLQLIAFALARIESVLDSWKEDNEGRLMGAKEVGLRLGLPTQSVLRMARLGEVPYYRISGRYMFNLKELKASRYVRYIGRYHKKTGNY